MAKKLTPGCDLDITNIEKFKNPSMFSYSSLIQVFKNSQQTIKVYERFINSKIPDKNKQEKEIRRKERLKSLYRSYMDLLEITSSGFKPSKPAYIQSETQLKSLISHQHSVLLGFRNIFNKKPSISQSFAPSIYKNPLIFKILALFSPESKIFLPDSTRFQICSLYFHDEDIAAKTKKNLGKEIERKLTEFKSEANLELVINKRKTFEKSYSRVQNSLTEKMNEIFQSISRETSGKNIDKRESQNFCEGETAFCVNFNKVVLNFEKIYKGLKINVNEEETLEVQWTPTKKAANITRLGFFHKGINNKR